MSSTPETIGRIGLTFFGSGLASMTHELKNSLAILTENAGMLEDLALLMEQGAPPSAKRIRTLSGRVQKQVRRSDEIVGRMNHFAHGVDEEWCLVEVNDVLSVSLSLAERLAYLGGVTLEGSFTAEPVKLETAPFLAQALVWRCLRRAIEGTERGGKVELVTVPDSAGVHVAITCHPAWSMCDPAIFPSAEDMALQGALGADLTGSPEGRGVTLAFPSSRCPI
jgi:hypothetical protein